MTFKLSGPYIIQKCFAGGKKKTTFSLSFERETRLESASQRKKQIIRFEPGAILQREEGNQTQIPSGHSKASLSRGTRLNSSIHPTRSGEEISLLPYRNKEARRLRSRKSRGASLPHLLHYTLSQPIPSRHTVCTTHCGCVLQLDSLAHSGKIRGRGRGAEGRWWSKSTENEQESDSPT